MNRIAGVMLVVPVAFMLIGCDTLSSGTMGTPWRHRDVDGGFTILLFLSSDEGHVELAEAAKRFAEAQAGWKELRVDHADNYSAVYWGRFANVDQAAGKLKLAKRLRLADGRLPFARALVVPIAGDDVGPPEWKLTAADGEYSVLVAVFYDDVKRKYIGRKQFAVDYCRQLRQEGREAYYYHGSKRSSVTVGSFGPSAVRTVIRDGEQRPQIVDPEMRRIMASFPFVAVNGRQLSSWVVDKDTGKAIQVNEKSYPIRIPGRKEGTRDESYHRLRDLE